MMCEPLSFFTTEELVRELLSRTTFVGIVVRSEREEKGDTGHCVFQAECSSNLLPDQALTILDGLVGQLKEAS